MRKMFLQKMMFLAFRVSVTATAIELLKPRSGQKCIVKGNCFRTPNYPDPYVAAGCYAEVVNTARVLVWSKHFDMFSSNDGSDTLKVEIGNSATFFSANEGPKEVEMSRGDRLTFTPHASRGGVGHNHTGFEVCARIQAPYFKTHKNSICSLLQSNARNYFFYEEESRLSFEQCEQICANEENCIFFEYQERVQKPDGTFFEPICAASKVCVEDDLRDYNPEYKSAAYTRVPTCNRRRDLCTPEKNTFDKDRVCPSGTCEVSDCCEPHPTCAGRANFCKEQMQTLVSEPEKITCTSSECSARDCCVSTTSGPLPQPTSASPPQATTGSIPQPTSGSAPQSTNGSIPQPTNGSVPQPTNGPVPQPTSGSAPQSTNGSAPQSTRGPPPQPTSGRTSRQMDTNTPQLALGSTTQAKDPPSAEPTSEHTLQSTGSPGGVYSQPIAGVNPGSKSSNVGMIVGIAVGVTGGLLALAAGVVVFMWLRGKNRQNPSTKTPSAALRKSRGNMYKPKAEESDDEEQSEEEKQEVARRAPAPSSPSRPTAKIAPASDSIPDQFPRRDPNMSANKHQLSRRSRHSRGTQIAMDMYSLELKRELLEAIPLSEGRTLATSNFDRLYLEARAPDHVGELFMACDKLIRSFVENEKGDVKDAKDFFNRLKNEAFEHQKTLRDNISAAAEYLWTSAQQLNGDSGPEFCSILNKTIRDDDPMDMVHAVLIIRAINMRTVAKRGDDDAAKNTKFRFPKNGICWRGTTFDMKHKDFFRAGVKYRVPGFLATSLQKSTAIMFITRRNDVIHRVLWEIRLDPRGAKQPLYRCQHVHYVHKTHVSGEDEYLFAPYSVFTVAQKPVWNETTSVDPHRIVLVSSLDNKRESVDLPLAPWY